MELSQVLRQRKSIRHYKEGQQLSEEQLEYILMAGMAAPISRKDYKSIKITVVQNPSLLGKLREAFDEKMDPFYGAPTVIIASTKPATVQNIEYLNVACVIENMLLAATDLTLGSIYLTSFLTKVQNRTDLLQELEILEGYSPISAIGVGYSDEKDEVKSEDEIRKRIEVIRK